MVKIDPKNKKYTITFKRKDQRLNQRDDKFEIFRSAIGLADIRDILDLSRYTQNHMNDPILKTNETVTDVNSYETPFITAKLTADQANALRKNPNIAFVEEEVVRQLFEEVVSWAVPRVKADSVWIPPLNTLGAGVNVAIIDNGMDPHVDFGSPSNVKVNQNFTSGSGTAPNGDVRHGTHVGGIVGAARGNDIGVIGNAPSCNLWNLKAGVGINLLTADTNEALAYAAQNGAHVVNMSYGGPDSFQSEQNLFTSGYAAGIVYVAAAGNDGTNTVNYPASYSGTLGISNLNMDGALLPGVPGGSTFGPSVDFTAPGTDILSLWSNNQYAVSSGTSMACPEVSGIFALMLSAYRDNGCPPYTPGAKKNDIVIAVMRDTATKTGLVSPSAAGQKDIRYGWGLPQADKAVAALKGVLLQSIRS